MNMAQHPRLGRLVHAPLRAIFDPLPQPIPDARIRDVHELESNCLTENGF